MDGKETRKQCLNRRQFVGMGVAVSIFPLELISSPSTEIAKCHIRETGSKDDRWKSFPIFGIGAIGAGTVRHIVTHSSPIIEPVGLEEKVYLENQNIVLRDAQMVTIVADLNEPEAVVTSGMLAKRAKQLGILTVGVVPVPKTRTSHIALKRLAGRFDSIFSVYPGFGYCRSSGTRALSSLAEVALAIPKCALLKGDIGMDWIDIVSLVKGRGIGTAGISAANGQTKGYCAVDEVLRMPVVHHRVRTCSNILVAFSLGDDCGLCDVAEGMESVEKLCSEDTSILFQGFFGDARDGEVKVTMISTGEYNYLE